MYITTKAIFLNAIRYQEKSLIVKCFTEAEGIKSFFVKNAFSKSKTQNIAYFQPLTLLEIQYKEKKKGSLHYFHHIRLLHPYVSLANDYDKRIVVMFLTEVLNLILQENQENKDLFAFLQHSFIWFDTCEWDPNFHLYLLFQITKYLGFYPDDNYEDHLYFNKKEGYFTHDFQWECMNEEETLLFIKGLNIRLGESNLLNGAERKQILHLLIDYYQTHQLPFKTIHSLQVVNELY